MEFHVTLAVLFAALFHATWNSLIKGGKNPLMDSMLLSSVWLVACICTLPFLPIPNPESWIFAVITIPIHVGYFFLLSRIYRSHELSVVYPIIRGSPPMIVAVVGFCIMDEGITATGWLGIMSASIGIL